MIHEAWQVEEMKNTVEQFQHERRQLTSKMSAMQMGINQLEREAAIRAHIENELSSVPSKVLMSWYSVFDLFSIKIRIYVVQSPII